MKALIAQNIEFDVTDYIYRRRDAGPQGRDAQIRREA